MKEKNERKPEALYKPTKLLPFGQKLYDFCQEFPAVVFNAPADYQEEFKKEYASQMADTVLDHSRYLRMTAGLFYKNKPINDFLEKVEEGTYLMLSVMGKKKLVTAVVKVGAYFSDQGIPESCRIDFHKTRGFQKYVGRADIWSGHVLAATIVDGLRREMAILDPDAEIFIAKARKYAVTLDEYYQRNFQIAVTEIPDSHFRTMIDGEMMINKLFRVTEARGRLFYPGTEVEIQIGNKIDANSLMILAEQGHVIYH